MKLATAIATIAAASFTLVTADAPCDAKLTTALTAAATNQAKCKTESGFDITAAAPMSPILTKFCNSSTCVSLWKTLKALGLSECMIYDKHLNKEILNPLAAACPALTTTSNSTATPTTSSNSTTTTKAPTATTVAPSTTTKAPTATTVTPTTTKAPSASNATSGNSTAAKTPSTTPAVTTKAPTPSTSGASTLSVTAGAVVLAIAASFL